MFNEKTIGYTYDDIFLIPKYTEITTRKDVETEMYFGAFGAKVPVVPANMKCTINESLARQLALNGYFYIMHRFEIDIVEFTKNMQDTPLVSICIGVQNEDCEILKAIKAMNLRVDCITIDIAHGHCRRMVNMIKYIKENFNTTIIAGNVATFEAVMDLNNAGADFIKVGIGQGKVCTTKLKTGFTYPMFSCIYEISRRLDFWTNALNSSNKPQIIADGGIEHNGDIAKALVAGADAVMCGNLFAQCSDSPAPTVAAKKIEGGYEGQFQEAKRYFGSASIENNRTHNIEGIEKIIPSNGMTYLEKFAEITEDLQSACSYAGVEQVGGLHHKIVDVGIRYR